MDYFCETRIQSIPFTSCIAICAFCYISYNLIRDTQFKINIERAVKLLKYEAKSYLFAAPKVSINFFFKPEDMTIVCYHKHLLEEWFMYNSANY